MPELKTTRERLLDAGMALFAERGFRATSVGDIEAAVGLQPRRGALYNHFASKEALLEEGAREYIATVASSTTQIEQLPLPTVTLEDIELLRPIIKQLGLWILDMTDRQQLIVRLLEHDGPRLEDFRKLLLHDVIDEGNRAAAHMFRTAVPAFPDPEATAVLLLASLTGVRRATWTYGDVPLGVSDKRVIAGWVDIVLGVIAAAIEEPKKRVRGRGRGRTR